MRPSRKFTGTATYIKGWLLDIAGVLPKDSFFARYMQAWPTSEPPLSFILLAGLAALGSVLGRRVWLEQDVHTIFPLLNLLIIGPSGIGKSTSVDHIAMQLIDNLPPDEQPFVVRDASTKEKLHADLTVEPHAMIIASELAAFFTKEKYKEGMIPYVTRMLDYPPTLSLGTRKDGSQVVNKPAVSIVGCSTVEWLQEQLPDSAAKGGFLARFLIVKEDHKHRRVADPKSMLSQSQWAELNEARINLFREFRELTLFHRGPIDFRSFEAKDVYSFWYNTQMPETGHLSPFSARAGEFVLRLSMLLAISAHRSLIEAEDVAAAIELYNYCAKKLQEVVVPFSPQGRLIAQVLQLTSTNPVTPSHIKRAMRNYCGSQDVERILDSLLQSADIVRTSEGLYKRALAPKETNANSFA